MEAIAPPLVETPVTVLNEVEKTLSQALRTPVKVLDYDQLAFRMSPVARLRLGGQGVPSSVILKHIPAANFPATSPEDLISEFREEAAAYLFLEKVGVNKRANRLACDLRGFMLLEDLGHQMPLKPDRLVAELAETLAEFHGKSMGKEEDYKASRVSCGLPSNPKAAPHNRNWASSQKRFHQGTEEVRRMCEMMRLAQAPLMEASQAIRRSIAQPGIFGAFIHDDLANGRQTRFHDGQLKLLDFENSTWGHCLRDLVRPLIGKFEILIATKQRIWNDPAFPLALVDQYRAALAAKYGIAFSEEDWQAGFSDAILFGAFRLIGKLFSIPPETLAGNPLSLFKEILLRVIHVLDGRCSHPQVLSIFQELVTRINNEIRPSGLIQI